MYILKAFEFYFHLGDDYALQTSDGKLKKNYLISENINHLTIILIKLYLRSLNYLNDYIKKNFKIIKKN